MQQDYSQVLDGQNALFRDKITKMFTDVDSMKNYLDNIRCKNSEIVMKMAPFLTSELVVNSPELIELIIDDIVEDEVNNQTFLERIKGENREYIEYQIKRNKVKKMVAGSSQLGVWQMVEKLEEYKDDIGC